MQFSDLLIITQINTFYMANFTHLITKKFVRWNRFNGKKMSVHKDKPIDPEDDANEN